MAGYTRQSSADIVTGNVIRASHFNAEYNQIEAAFNASTGHNHDGSTAGNGPKLSLTAAVTGTLPVANGGSGAATFTGGVLVANGTSAFITRTITGTSNEITVTNGSGVSGAPTLSLPTSLTFTGKTVTGGTFNSGAFNGTVGASSASTGAFTTLAASNIVTLSLSSAIIAKNNDTGSLSLSGGTDANNGSALVLFGDSHSTNANDIMLSRGTGTSRINVYQWDDSADEHITKDKDGDTILRLTNSQILVDTGYIARTASNGTLLIAGGADVNNASSIWLYGHAHSTQADDIEFYRGTGSSRSIVYNWDESADRHSLRNAAGTYLMIVGPSAVTVSADLVLNGTSRAIRANTADGADNAEIYMAGGGIGSATRGGMVLVYGNEHSSNPGKVILQAGTAGNITIDGAVTMSSTLSCVGIYNSTTASAANVNVDLAGGLFRSTSALKYKQDLRSITDEEIAAFLSVSGISYRSAIKTDDQTRRHYGIVADHLHEAGLSGLVHYGEGGEVEGTAYERTTAFLLEAVKRLTVRVEALEA